MLYATRIGELELEWTPANDLQIRRVSTGEIITLSLSEREWIAKLDEIHETPVAPPRAKSSGLPGA